MQKQGGYFAKMIASGEKIGWKENWLLVQIELIPSNNNYLMLDKVIVGYLNMKVEVRLIIITFTMQLLYLTSLIGTIR